MTESTITAPITVRENVTVQFSAIALSGDIVFDSNQNSLVLIDRQIGQSEAMSITFESMGLKPVENCVLIKDWTEHRGLAANLESLGIVRLISEFTANQFGNSAYLARVLV